MTTEKAGGVCDGCGRPVVRFTRRYKDERFCATCYAREFPKGPCPKCGKQARIYRRDPNAVCLPCTYAGKPCIRCTRVGRPWGKFTRYGPVCNACAPYFRTAKPCARCGMMSTHLSRVSRLGIDQSVCPACQKLDHGTCSSCRRYRLLTTTDDGKPICNDCLTGGEIALLDSLRDRKTVR